MPACQSALAQQEGQEWLPSTSTTVSALLNGFRRQNVFHTCTMITKQDQGRSCAECAASSIDAGHAVCVFTTQMSHGTCYKKCSMHHGCTWCDSLVSWMAAKHQLTASPFWHSCTAVAATHWCKIVPTPLTPDDISVDYNQHNVEFTAATALATNTTDLPAQMRIRMEGSSGARVRPKAPPQLFGQFEVTAKVTEAVGAVTAFYVSVQGHEVWK